MRILEKKVNEGTLYYKVIFQVGGAYVNIDKILPGRSQQNLYAVEHILSSSTSATELESNILDLTGASDCLFIYDFKKKDTSKKTVFYGHIKNRPGIKAMIIGEKY